MDDNSVQTQLRKNSSVRKVHALRRMVLVVSGFCLFAMYFGRSSPSGDQHNVARSLYASSSAAASRSLYTPYDTSTAVTLPTWTDNLADVWDPVLATDTPLYWFIPKAGGTTIVKIFSFCLGLVLASNKGIQTGNTTLGVYQVGRYSPYPHFAKYVNVKTQNQVWIRRCAQRGLLESGLADVVSIQNLVYAGETLFTPSYRGRGFVMMRHPVKRAVDLFYYRQHATWERTYDAELAVMSLEDYVASDKVVENLEVRMLNNLKDFSVEVTEAHVAVAKEILRRKFVVGIFEWFDVSMVRIEKYFGWWEQHKVMSNLTVNNCHYRIIEHGDHIGNFPKVPDKENIYSILMTRNWADVELYHYSKTLFAEQAKLL